MKRYLLFHGYIYYPAGGWDDFEESFDTLDDAKAYVEKNRPNETYSSWGWYHWYHIIDSQTNEKIVDK